jgi:hypothetical protein
MSGDQDDPDDDSVAGGPHDGADDEPPQQDDEDTTQEQPPSRDQDPGQGQQGGGQPQGPGGAGVGAGAGAPPQGQQGPPQGGRPQGQQGPPQGGQPPGQQPQGGYQQGGARQPVQTGPSVGDIFSRPDTKEEMISGVVLYAMLGVGLFVAAFLIPLATSVFTMSLMLFGALALGPLLAVVLADRQDEALDSVPDALVYATAAVTAIGGTIAYGIIAAVGGAIGDSVGSGGGGVITAGFSPGDYILGALLVAIAGAVAAVALVALNRTVLADSPAPRGGQRQPPAQGQGQTMQGQGGNQPPQQGQQR